MPVASAFAIYFVLWWIVLFAVLPFGVKSQAEAGDERGVGDPGAPILARMKWKLMWTTIVSIAIFAPAMFAFYQGWLNVERISHLMGFPF